MRRGNWRKGKIEVAGFDGKFEGQDLNGMGMGVGRVVVVGF